MIITQRGTNLFGMMGAGKSTLGRMMAEELEQPFVDTDALIEIHTGIKCGQLVMDGVFGEIQRDVILGFKPESATVVATGGSVASTPELPTHLGRYGMNIFIMRDPGVLDAELSEERKAALNNPKRLSFVDLYIERIPLYQEACEATLEVGVGETPEETTERLIRLREEA